MGAPRAGRAATNAEASGKLGLSGGSERRAFFVPHTDPLDCAAANRISERIERVAN
jgi:hypothetical protein